MPGVYPRGREGGRGLRGFGALWGARQRGEQHGDAADGGVATGHLYPESWWPPSRTWSYGEPDTLV